MARVHRSRFIGRAGKSRLPTKMVGGPDDPTNGDGPRLVLLCRMGDFVEKGEPYLWFAPGFRSAKRIGCMKHPPKASEMDSSAFSEVLGAQEDANEALNGITWNAGETADDIRAAVDEAIQPVKDAIDSVADQYDSAAESMGGSNGAGAQFEEWASTLRDAEIVNWEARDYEDPDEGDEDASCEKHGDGSDEGMVGEADDQFETYEDLEQARANCPDCQALREVDLTDWTSDLVDEARGKVDDVQKE